MSTDHLVDTERVRELCKEQRRLVQKGFPPYQLNLTPTVHQLYSHLANKIGIKRIRLKV